MKELFKLLFFGGLFLGLFICVTASSQAGLTNSGPTQEQERNQAGNDFDYGNKSGSALQQLENMTGEKITTSNTNGQQYNRSASTVNKINAVSSAASFQNYKNAAYKWYRKCFFQPY